MRSTAMNIVHVTAELSPLAQTGGLGDMVASLGKATHELGHHTVFILPKYQVLGQTLDAKETLATTLHISVGGQSFSTKIWKSKHPSGIPLYLIDIPELFYRSALYGEHGTDYADNAIRFLALSKAALELIKQLNLPCDIVHCHDWHTAFIPVYLKTLYAHDSAFQKSRSVLTIHNLSYQGVFPVSTYPRTDLPWNFFNYHFLEFYNQVNFLKGGLVAADAVNTVSPTYAKEILTPEFGYGLENAIKERDGNFSGIVNGIDTKEWNPATDQHLPAHYSIKNLRNKSLCKKTLQEKLGLPRKPKAKMVGMISRLVEQKGFDLILEVIPRFIDQDVQWVFLGSGNPQLEAAMTNLAQTYPEKVSATIGFHKPLSHLIEAGADFFLMPSRYEPCGYNQMYSQRYGTIPIARATGGLVDTIADLGKDHKKGTGFLFQNPSPDELEDALIKAFDFYGKPRIWTALIKRAMQQDFSWKCSAQHYMELYRNILIKPQTLLTGI